MLTSQDKKLISRLLKLEADIVAVPLNQLTPEELAELKQKLTRLANALDQWAIKKFGE
jgi:hypothetical protein